MILFLIIAQHAQSQIAGETGNQNEALHEIQNAVQEEDAYARNNMDWVSSLLNAGVNPLYNFVIYNGRIFSWNLRGENQSLKIIDGINWRSNIKMWSADHLFTGINFVYKKTETIVNGAVSSNGYWPYATVSIMNAENTLQKKEIAILGSFSSTSNVQNVKSFALHYTSGIQAHQIYWSSAIKIEDAPLGVLPNGFKKSFHLFYGLDKILKKQASIGLSILWNMADQGRAATTTNEMFLLSQQRVYSPNWGWYHQQAYFPSTRQNNVPIMSWRYQKKWNEKSALYLNNGLLIGKESNSNLEWNHTRDPRPDYYKYLPSYLSDTALSAQLSSWYQQHPNELQIHFDQLERINKASSNHQSFYIVNQENRELYMLHGSMLFTHDLKQKRSIQVGVEYAFDQIHFYNTIKDLLGGNFYYNYNSWMNEDTLTLSFQQDILKPNRKIKQGERWGADYTMRSFQAKPWMQLQSRGPVFETTLAVGYGLEGIERIGYNQNGLFANSKGRGGATYFSTADLKAQVVYKLNGRFYFRSILFSKWSPPSYNSLFSDPDINAFPSPFALQESQYGADLSIFYRSPSFKSSLSFYQKINENESENRMFYHDAYTLFVYGVVGHMNSVYNGLEYEAETNLIQNVKINYAFTFSNSNYLDNPSYQFLDVNNLQIKESGQLLIKGFPVNKSPKYVNALSILYQPVYGFTIGITSVFAQERPVDMNLFRRSGWVKNKVDPITWSLIQNPTYLNDQLVMNAFASKSFQFKAYKNAHKTGRWNMSVSVRNLFNALIPIIAYEQTRFDYLRFNKDKFALKYLMDAGTSFSFRFQLQIQ
jgi:hypothetical protein